MKVMWLSIFVCLIVAFVAFAVAPRKIITYRDNNVIAGKIESALAVFAVHASEEHYLTFGESTFRRVRGLKPYFMEVPQLDSIVFVTEERPHHVTIYIGDLQTKAVMSINGDDCNFGAHIGWVRGQGFYDYVELSSNVVTLVTQAFKRKETSTVDLRAKRVVRQDIFFYDANGFLVSHKMRVNQEDWVEDGAQSGASTK
jgi:hypothetical protein